jgi:predicted PurR-regulated permease PerM
VFSTSSTVVAVLFAIWSVFAGSIDTVLKPLLMGRGLDVPVLVVFMGAIGGFLLDGIIGLFVGAVVLTLGYTLLIAWLGEAAADEVPESS